MIDVSPRFRLEPKGNPTIVGYADVYHGPEFVKTLVETGEGSVDTDESGSIRWTNRTTLVDEDGDLVPEVAATDVLNPFRAELRMRRGFRFSDGTEETVPCGVYRFRTLTYGEKDGALTVNVEGFDPSIMLQGKLPRPWVVETGEPVESEIIRLLSDVLPGLTFRMTVTGFTTPTLLLRAGEDPWGQATKLAVAAGCTLAFGRDGAVEMMPAVVAASAAYVWEFVEGEDSTFWEPSRTLTVDGEIANVVVVNGTNGGTTGIRAEVADLDPTSATYRFGPFGEQVWIEDSERVSDFTQAQAMAQGLLAQKLGPAEKVEFVASPNPALDVGDSVLVTRTKLGMDQRAMIVEAIGGSHNADAGMTVRCRRSILTGIANPFQAAA